jgi:16S rRNA C967 or C1407 C5-methylase (RsmB/RsmF family)
VALDSSPARLHALRAAAEAQGLSGRVVTCAADLRDAAAAAAEAAERGAAAVRRGGPPLRAAGFDRVLLDAPCSGAGRGPPAGAAGGVLTL